MWEGKPEVGGGVCAELGMLSFLRSGSGERVEGSIGDSMLIAVLTLGYIFQAATCHGGQESGDA